MFLVARRSNSAIGALEEVIPRKIAPVPERA